MTPTHPGRPTLPHEGYKVHIMGPFARCQTFLAFFYKEENRKKREALCCRFPFFPADNTLDIPVPQDPRSRDVFFGARSAEGRGRRGKTESSGGAGWGPSGLSPDILAGPGSTLMISRCRDGA